MENLSSICVNVHLLQPKIAFVLYCKTEYEESFNMINKVQQIEGEKSKAIVNLLNALILQILSKILKLQKYDEAQQFLDFIQHQIEKDSNKVYYQEILSIITLQKQQEHQEAQIQSLDFKKFVQKFLLRQIIQNVETLEIDYEYIYPKKSKIDYWLLTVDFQILIKDLWWLFNYDQKKQQI